MEMETLFLQGRTEFGSHHPETGWAQQAQAQLSGPFIFCIFLEVTEAISEIRGEPDPGKSPPHKLTAAAAAPAGSASKRCQQHSAVTTALCSIEYFANIH